MSILEDQSESSCLSSLPFASPRTDSQEKEFGRSSVVCKEKDYDGFTTISPNTPFSPPRRSVPPTLEYIPQFDYNIHSPYNYPDSMNRTFFNPYLSSKRQLDNSGSSGFSSPDHKRLREEPINNNWMCTNCSELEPRVASCSTCKETLCSACLDAHQRVRLTRDHIVIILDNKKDHLVNRLDNNINRDQIVTRLDGNNSRDQIETRMSNENINKVHIVDRLLGNYKDPAIVARLKDENITKEHKVIKPHDEKNINYNSDPEEKNEEVITFASLCSKTIENHKSHISEEEVNNRLLVGTVDY